MTVAGVPVKELSRAKSRLAGAVADRPGLALRLLSAVVAALRGSGVVDHILVVSPDPQVEEACTDLQVEFVLQSGHGLNEALDELLRRARELDARRLLVALGDLPDLRASEIVQLVALGEPGVVLAPDREERGTNLMLCEPPGCVPFRFGRDSLRLHREEAERRRLTVTLFRSPGTQRDLDVPAHLGGRP